MIYCPPERDLFEGATIDISLIALRKVEKFQVSRSSISGSPEWKYGNVRLPNWWSMVSSIWDEREAAARTGARLGDYFDVSGSMTTADAYEIKPKIVDDEFGLGQRLVTTGLIDPEECFWGISECRYLKSVYRFPRISEDKDFNKALNKRIFNSKRPKIIVAGLSSVVESYIDLEGKDIGSVATFSIFERSDNVKILLRLLEYLLSESVQQKLQDELGGNALGGGAVTMKKSFLSDLDLPNAIFEEISNA